MLSRRNLLKMAPCGLFLPQRLIAAAPEVDRKFLFIFCNGGWDVTKVFTPEFDNKNVDMEEDANAVEANGITFVDHENRPSVTAFFEQYGDRTAVVNGMEVRSVTHERCRELVFTGYGDGATDDWPVSLAANAEVYYPVPHLVLSGPAFTNEYSSTVVRSGDSGQLSDLLDGSALDWADSPTTAPSTTADELEEQFLKERIASYTAAAESHRGSRVGSLYGNAIDDLDVLLSMSDTVDLAAGVDGCRRDIANDCAVAFNAFEYELSRCVLTKDDGYCSMTWDTHSGNDYQDRHYEELFGFLLEAMEDLDSRTSSSGTPLADEVTIVLFSEMARHPQLTGDGRAHWSYTSFVLIGAGVQGGQVVGELDENFFGKAIDLASGQVDEDNGTPLLPGNLGATLLKIAGLDEAELLPDYAPIDAIIAS